jgi:CDP-diacylglycerol--glycerol-3-phosphate 3-phosphatidyltransferase
LSVPTPADRLTSPPNLLSLSRLPLAAALFACVSYQAWAVGLLVFSVAALTDALDGWLARRMGLTGAVGRALDPLTDKVLLGGAFVYLLPVPAAGLSEWMVATLIGRELVVTGLRGMAEAVGVSFGADRWGKLKTVLQCAWVVAVLTRLSWPHLGGWGGWVQAGLLWGMLVVTVGSGLNYARKAGRALGAAPTTTP